jgi:hypothetical protein
MEVLRQSAAGPDPALDDQVLTVRRKAVAGDQIEPTAELLTSGLAGLALWWIDHPELDKPVLVEVAARVSRGGCARNRAQPVGVNMSASPRSVGSPPGGASMVTSVASASSST